MHWIGYFRRRARRYRLQKDLGGSSFSLTRSREIVGGVAGECRHLMLTCHELCS
jgi:hypothetical protein